MAERHGGRWVAAMVAVLLFAFIPPALARARADYGVPRPPVVLVTGLDDSTPGMRPGGDCGSVGSMATLCSNLVGAGYQVYVVPSSSGGGGVIDNHGAFDPNARRLANYLATVVRVPALLVGHSMGGILSRIAISRYGASAAGLFTIASPHDGSFGADLVEGTAGLPCSGLLCLALQEAAKLIIGHMGTDAVAGLTQSARAADNAGLAPPGVPTWTYVGTVCHGPDPTGGYYFPNDGIVGESSAYGVTANLGSTVRSSSSAFHQSTLESVLKPVCSPFSGTDVELVDPTVLQSVLGAAACVTAGGCHTAADLASAARVRRHRRARRPSRIRFTLHLATAQAHTVSPGGAVAVSRTTSLVSTSPFTASCGSTAVPALPALEPGLYGLAPGALGCSSATIASSQPVTLGVVSNPDTVRARIVSVARRRLRITLIADGPIASARLARGARALARRRGHGRRRLVLTVRRRSAAGLRLTALVAGQSYAAVLPPLP